MSDEVREIQSKTASSAFALLSRRLIVMVLSTATTSVVAHSVDPEKFGILSAATATYMLVLSLSDLGFTSVLSRRVPSEPENTGPLMRAALQIQIGWATLAALLFAGISLMFPQGERTTLLLILAPAIAVSGLTGIRQLMIIRFATRKLTFIDVMTNIGQSVMTIALIVLGFGIEGAAFSLGLWAIINASLSFSFGRALMGEGRASSELRRGILREALPLGIGSVLASLYFSIDMILLGFLVEGDPLGWYAAAVKMLSMLVIIPNLLVAVVLPGIAATRGNDGGARLAAASWHWMIISALPMCVGVAVFARPIMTTLFGQNFAAATDMTRVLALAGAVSLASNVFGMLMVNERKGMTMLWQNIAALTLNVSGNFALVPRYGPIASAWITVATEGLVSLGSYVVLRKKLDFSLLARTSVKPFAAVVAMAGIGLALLEWPIPAIFAAGVTFLGALTVLKGWPEDLSSRFIKGSRRATPHAG